MTLVATEATGSSLLVKGQTASLDVRGQSAAIASLNAAIPSKIESGMYYYQNNLPYAEWLEYGSDKHRGQVRIELQRIRRALAGD